MPDPWRLHKLAALDPDLSEKVHRLLMVMHILDHPMCITDGIRTAAQQATLYAQGRGRPGKIVTHADGVRVVSNHQRGKAVDCAFLLEAGGVTWEGPWDVYGICAETLGLSWGGRWTIPDRPHVEMT